MLLLECNAGGEQQNGTTFVSVLRLFQFHEQDGDVIQDGRPSSLPFPPPLKSPIQMSKQEVDLFRDTPVRYLGYANELGEAFRPLYPRFVVPSYLVSFGYVVADTYDKATKERHRLQSSVAARASFEGRTHPEQQGASINSRVAAMAADTLLWQSFASVIVPGFTIHRVVAASGHLVKGMSPQVVKTAPTFIGLAAIPAIIHPIVRHATVWGGKQEKEKDRDGKEGGSGGGGRGRGRREGEEGRGGPDTPEKEEKGRLALCLARLGSGDTCSSCLSHYYLTVPGLYNHHLVCLLLLLLLTNLYHFPASAVAITNPVRTLY